MTRRPLFLILLLAVAVTTMPAYADDDKWDDDDEYERIGFGEREDGDNEREDDEQIRLGTGLSNMVLYVTITAIVGTIGYTGFRIINAKKPKMTSK